MCQISELLEKYKNMSHLIQRLQKENENNVNQNLVLVGSDVFHICYFFDVLVYLLFIVCICSFIWLTFYFLSDYNNN
jgi:quinol-cytochrome oxidoreductase complex cytochrome b subunit